MHGYTFDVVLDNFPLWLRCLILNADVKLETKFSPWTYACITQVLQIVWPAWMLQQILINQFIGIHLNYIFNLSFLGHLFWGANSKHITQIILNYMNKSFSVIFISPYMQNS